eukprot:6186968-Pleurochrysis_carterae.AAC.15
MRPIRSSACTARTLVDHVIVESKFVSLLGALSGGYGDEGAAKAAAVQSPYRVRVGASEGRQNRVK